MVIFNDPKHLTKNDYVNAIERYIERASSLEGVKSIYMMGGVGAPGLSDLDMIVVVDDDFYPGDSEKLCTKGIDDRLFIHGPVVLPQYIAGELQYIIYASNLKLLYGGIDLPSFSDVPDDEAHILRLCYLVDFTESRLIQYAGVFAEGKVDKRAWMTRLWSVTYSKSIANDLGVSLNEDVCFEINKIKAIRNSWSQIGKVHDKEFLEAFWGGYRANLQIFTCAVNAFYEKPDCSDFNYSTGSKRFVFSAGHEIPRYKARRLNIFGKSVSGYKCDQLLSYAAHLDCYGALDESDKFAVKSNMHTRIMQKRRRIVQDHKRWLQDKAPKACSMQGYLGFDVGGVRNVSDCVRSLGGYILASF